MAASRRPGRWLAVAVGGALGTVARYELTRAIPVRSERFPWAIALVNLVGCLVVGVIMAVLRARPRIPDDVRLFVVVGVCGGLTTFSTWMVDDVLLVHDGAGGVALADLVGTLVVGVLAVWLAYRVTATALRVPPGDVLDVREAD